MPNIEELKEMVTTLDEWADCDDLTPTDVQYLRKDLRRIADALDRMALGL